MPRPEKVQVVAQIKERLETTPAIFLTEYRGLSVGEQQMLRRNLRQAEADYKVIKMSLARRAAEEAGLDALGALLSGPTALAFSQGDPVQAAKALRDFGREHAQLLIKGAWLNGQLLAPEKVDELADLEPREVILSRIAAGVKGPLAKMALLMVAFTRNTATALSQLLEKRQAEEPETEPEQEDEAEDEAEAKAAEPSAEEVMDEAAAAEETSELAPEAQASGEADREAQPGEPAGPQQEEQQEEEEEQEA